MSLYSSLHHAGMFSGRDIFYRQLMWMAMSWVALIIVSSINYRTFHDRSYLFYGLNILLLFAVLFIGHESMGAQRWLSLAGFTFQPSELSKITAILVLARCFAAVRPENMRRYFFIALGLIMFNALLIIKQPDLGTGLTLPILFMLMGFSSMIKKRYFIILSLLVCMTIPFAWNFLKPYQRDRLTVFVNPNVDPLGAGYTIIQSKVAIGSGGIAGKGFLSGTQNQFNFLPERHSDFIFTVVAEEWGFLGSLFLLFIYWIILSKILDKSKELKDNYARYLLMGIAAMIFIHVFVNIGMTLGILPVVGIPLSFISYGGTNLLMTMILIGLFLGACRE